MLSLIKIVGSFKVNTYKLINNKLQLIDVYEDFNKVVTIGKTKICMLLTNDGSTNHINHIGFGTSSVAATINDTTLTGLYSKSLTSYSYPTSNSVLFSWTLGLGENNGMSINEYGLYTDDNTLFARKVKAEVVKTADILLNGEWTITFV